MGDGNYSRGYMPSDQSGHPYPSVSQPSVEALAQRRSSMEFEQTPFQHHGFAHPQQGTSPLNMQALGSALPNYSPASTPFAQQQQQQQQSLQQTYPHPASHGVIYQIPQMGPFAGQMAPNTGQYGAQFSSQQFPHQYQHINQPRPGPPAYPSMGSSPQRGVFTPGYPTSQHQLQRPQGNYPPQFQSAGQQYLGSSPGQSFPRNSPYSMVAGPSAQNQYPPSAQQLPSTQFGSGFEGTSSHLSLRSVQGVSRQSSASDLGPSAPRGPPPKPRQSGHALWIGNLPPSTTIFDLKDHFSQGATDDIESVFLISKSNCAFANYKTEATCAAAMQRFNDTRFLGAKLVCRLRRLNPTATSTTGSRPPSAPNAEVSAEISTDDVVVEGHSGEKGEDTLKPALGIEEKESQDPEVSQPKIKEKFFIIKSLTIEDLELSGRNGIWATQAHNEATLNNAFETAENVYLIFSANKSGEYFGYARMLSQISDESAATIDFTPRNPSPSGAEPDLPNKIPTPATQHAPKGYVIDDSARGTIFWEAESPDEPIEAGEHSATQSESSKPARTSDEQTTAHEEPASETQSFGKPFRIEWMSTDRLPFYRTRGLRNPWNSNREVKIARDGTELEPSIGRRLVSMFHRPQIPGGPANINQGPPLQPAAGYPIQPYMGYSPTGPAHQHYYQGQ